MSKFFGLRTFNTPIIRPLYPFFVGMAITFYGVAKLQASMLDTEEWRNNPQSPTCKFKLFI
jgi:F-type H+-transporting ATPase subunit j